MHQWGENIPILRKANPQSLQQFAESFFFSVSYPCVIEISFKFIYPDAVCVISVSLKYKCLRCRVSQAYLTFVFL